MTFSFSGEYRTRSRVITGLKSFDLAVSGNTSKGQYGLPLRCGYHIYGPTGVGKTTFALSLAGMLSNLGPADVRGLGVMPIDTFDRSMAEEILIYSGLSGNCEFVLEDDHNKSLGKLKKVFAQEDVLGTVLDSVHALLSVAEEEGEAVDANMGRKAKMASTYIKQVYQLMTTSKQDKFFILTNLLFPNLGTMGYHTSGGMTPNSLTSIHIKLQKGRIKNKEVSFEQGRLLKGKVEKNNFGVTGKEFNVFVLGGYGIHRGLTAVYDCLHYGLAEEGRKISLDGVKIASIKDMIENHRDGELFKPFVTALNEASGFSTSLDESDEGIQTPEEIE